MPQQPTRFGPELRRRRLAAQLSLTRLGQLVHYSKSQLSKVERGLKPPSPELARLCDTTLDAAGALTSLAPTRPAPAAPALPTPTDPALPAEPDEGEVWLMHLSSDGPSWFQPVARRTLMAAGGATAVTFTLGAAPREAAPQECASLLATARSLFDHYRTLGQSAGGDVILPALVAQTHSLRRIALRAGPRTRDDLLSLASRYAEYVGWLVQETGDDRGALWWTDRAVELAEAGGDRDLAAYALVRRALVTLYRDEAAQTIELAAHAQSFAAPARVRGLAAQREAQGHALAGDYDACMSCLDRARELLGHAAEDDGSPMIGTTTLPDPVAMITGWCLHDLGRPREAAEILDHETGRLPAHALRSQTRYGLRRALAHAAAGEIDHACALLMALAPATDTLASATLSADLRRLSRTLSRRPTPTTRSLAPWLAGHHR
ncbi:helix-turn-helix domain-containing protein [Streptomyces iconiensis]|uniref:Helix-turn-helix transcriptional regulator n=1 Tax=Streptomyces iconiensis TaxID=1384038 RepID=A0ABT6ZVC8_9ACTN|nr:helix-turn-helix transcriptional regulator [Streptomyces iconiensis]MDJ1132388.1 helix-turn-helix transcriptional regulator [Streptomyces iconiensis]